MRDSNHTAIPAAHAPPSAPDVHSDRKRRFHFLAFDCGAAKAYCDVLGVVQSLTKMLFIHRCLFNGESEENAQAGCFFNAEL